MAGKRILTQIELLINSTLGSPESGYIGIGAKSGGLYMKTPSVEYMLLSEANRRSDVRATGNTGSDIVTETGIRAAIEAGYTHTHPYQPVDADLTAIAALSGTSGILKKTAANTWTLDTGTYLTGTKVDSFNSRTGVVTLTKADVESVLTGAITSHTHAYDNYGSWSCSADGTGTELIVSGKRVNFIGDGNGITVNSYDVSGTHTMRINNTKPFPGFGTIAGVAAEGNHTHTGYASSTHTHTLASLTDTTITSVASGEILKWNGSAWINNTLAEAGIQAVGAMSLASLSDTTITSPATGEILKWSGIKWINNTLAEAGIAAASHTHAYDNYGSWQAQAGGNTLDITSDSWLNFVGGTGISLVFDTTYHKITITNTSTTPTTVVTTATSTATSAASVNISGLSVALISGKVYEFEAVLNIGVSAAAGGSNFGINYSSGTTAYVVIGTGSSSQATSWRMTSLTNLVGGFLLAASDSGMVILKGIIKPTASSNLTIKHQKTGSGSSYVYANSYLKVTEIS